MNGVREFRVPPVIVTGLGAVKEVGSEAKKLGSKKALIVTDKTMIEVGNLDGVKESLDAEKIPYEVFDKVMQEPVVEYVDDGLTYSERIGCDMVIAVGGGSPIDTAKAISIMARNPGSIRDYMGLNKIEKPGLPLVAIPATAGTGSEVSRFTIITDPEKDLKMLIGSPYLIPQVALVDPNLTLSMPRELTASTGIDALCHAVEAYISIKANPMADLFSLSAIRMLSGNLLRAWADGRNLESRELTMLGAMQAGIAFSNSSVALVHGMSRPIGAYFHVPHGLSNAALLAVVLEFSIIGNPKRIARIAEAMGEDVSGLGDTEAARRASQAVKRLISDLKIPSLRELGVKKERLDEAAPQMAKDAIASGSPGNNPRQATEQEIIELYHLAF
jgi:alcohol dehydrogenase class IV